MHLMVTHLAQDAGPHAALKAFGYYFLVNPPLINTSEFFSEPKYSL